MMGLVEVAGRYFQLRGTRRWLARHFLRTRPDVFIGIDSPDFNLGLEETLKKDGIRTVHYVGPSVWAWRSGRIRQIRRAADLMLVLFPFESEVYRQNGVACEFVGHALADRIGLDHDKRSARETLGIAGTGKLVALMPGSRQSELERMWPLQLETAAWIHDRHPDLVFATSVLSPQARAYIESVRERMHPEKNNMELHVFVEKSHEVLAAADAALLTSGTVTLEAMLYGLPMVVAYRVHALSYRIIRPLVKIDMFALPNLLSGRRLVPEFVQDDCHPAAMGGELLRLLEGGDEVEAMMGEFRSMHQTLQRGAAGRAAEAILSLAGRT